MKTFIEQKFNIGELIGISQDSIAEHLKLYSGYVKHSNLIISKINELKNDLENNSYAIGELQRRFGFEFCGMRNHEYYFRSLEGGAKELSKESNLYKKIEEEWDSYENWLSSFKTLALTRGIGWAMLYYDKETSRLLNTWVDEQHLGQLTGLKPILALDMWEHSFVADYKPSGKKNYVEDFFKNLNWSVVESNFS